MARIISLNITSNNDYEHETINSTYSFTGDAYDIVQTNVNGFISDDLLDGVILRSRQPVKDKDLSSPPSGPSEGDRYLVGQGTGTASYDDIALSDLATVAHNGAYSLAMKNGSPVTGIIEIEGNTVYFDTETEAERVITVSGTNVGSVDGKSADIVKQPGFLTKAGNRYTWTNGTTGSAAGFYWYYWNPAENVLVAWDNSNLYWKAFNLTSASGAGISAFLADLASGTIADGRYFDLPSSFIGMVASVSSTYPDEMAKVPHGNNVAYATPRAHNYYMYQDSSKTKIIAYSEKSGFWTNFVLSNSLDLSTMTVADNHGFSQQMFNWDLLGTASMDYGNGKNIPSSAHASVSYPGATNGPTGDWASFAVNDIVEYKSGAWVKETPSVVAGTYVFVEDESAGYIFNGTDFHIIGAVQQTSPVSASRQMVTVGSSPVSKGDLLYYSGNNVVGKHPNTSNAQPIGFAASSAAAHSQVELQTEGVIEGVLSNVFVNEKIFWTTNGLSSNPDSAAGTRVRVVGVSANGSDLQLIPLQQATIN